MKHIARADHTHKIRGERVEDGETILEGVGDLSARVHRELDGTPVTTSHWQPDEDDLRILNAGGVLELDLMTHQIPPQRITAVPLEPDPAAIEEAERRGLNQTDRSADQREV